MSPVWGDAGIGECCCDSNPHMICFTVFNIPITIDYYYYYYYYYYYVYYYFSRICF